MPNRTPVFLAVTATFAALLAVPVVVKAQGHRNDDESYFAAKLQLGVAGNVGAGGLDGNAAISYGAALAYMHPLHRYFVLGAEVAAQSWQTQGGADINADRNLLFDLTLVPQLRWPLAGIVELYLSLPIGLALDFLNGVGGINVAGIGGADVDPALGFTFSALVGARFTLTGSFGLLAELGYTLHSFSHTLQAQAAGIAINGVDIDVDIEQLALRAGVYF